MDQISAADIEKYGYCPLSWWLSWRDNRGGEEALQSGKTKHEGIAKSVSQVRKLELRARTMERIVFWCAVIATFVAMLGVDLLPFQQKPKYSVIMIVISLIWILAAVIFLRSAFKTPAKVATLQYEKTIIIFAIIAVIVAINAVVFLQISESLAQLLEAVSLGWLILASFFLNRSLTYADMARVLKKELNIKGVVEYVDFGESELLVSEKYGVSGRPDYVLMVDGVPIPVEEKTGRIPRGPLFSHILQVATYCLLMEEKTGKTIPYGVLRYGADQHIIEYDDIVKRTVLQKIGEMREIANGKPAHRNHNRPNKCTGCSRRENCPERLA
jgi:CRISPR-associated exonuclease Cas4